MTEEWTHGFHLGGGLWFKRLEGGEVLISLLSLDGNAVLQRWQATPDEWASVVLEVSARSEGQLTGNDHNDALAFHQTPRE